jgi:hypothetical protein
MPDKSKKKRISTLAKAYDVPGEVLLRLLKDAEVEVKSAASMISAETFALIKPALLKEKERMERKKMAKAGIKIPMKAVLKKKSKPAAEVKKEKPAKAEAEEKEKKAKPSKEKKAEVKGKAKPEKTETEKRRR